ncbi:MAG: hypothetical protein AN484_24715, partial [Aphanizomenon flos-aquae WA102]
SSSAALERPSGFPFLVLRRLGVDLQHAVPALLNILERSQVRIADRARLDVGVDLLGRPAEDAVEDQVAGRQADLGVGVVGKLDDLPADVRQGGLEDLAAFLRHGAPASWVSGAARREAAILVSGDVAHLRLLITPCWQDVIL